MKKNFEIFCRQALTLSFWRQVKMLMLTFFGAALCREPWKDKPLHMHFFLWSLATFFLKGHCPTLGYFSASQSSQFQVGRSNFLQLQPIVCMVIQICKDVKLAKAEKTFKMLADCTVEMQQVIDTSNPFAIGVTSSLCIAYLQPCLSSSWNITASSYCLIERIFTGHLLCGSLPSIGMATKWLGWL